MGNRFVNFGLLFVASWTVMTMSHEVGHLVGGWAGGGTLADFDLAPWRLPYSVHNPDPNPRLTLWAGPLLGVAVPVAAALALRRNWSNFVADFCLIANGTYLALGWATGDPLLDTPKMLAAGTSPALIATYCVVTIGVGYARFRADCVFALTPRGPSRDREGPSPVTVPGAAPDAGGRSGSRGRLSRSRRGR